MTIACGLPILQQEQDDHEYALSDYEGARARWCPGCGDHSILAAVQKLLTLEQLAPEQTVFVSGIGCSSRFPHYLKTYGFHCLHGRALPVATGIRLHRPDLTVFVVMGDGDCTSIGAGHWIHALRYNLDMVVMLLDNGIYGLTKNQTSPTTPQGFNTNTQPRGSLLQPLNPIQVALGVTNASFVARRRSERRTARYAAGPSPPRAGLRENSPTLSIYAGPSTSGLGSGADRDARATTASSCGAEQGLQDAFARARHRSGAAYGRRRRPYEPRRVLPRSLEAAL